MPLTIEPSNEVNFILTRGATFNPELIWENSDGTVVNLTGYTARMDVRADPTSAELLTQLLTGSGITIDGPNGKISLLIASATTKTFLWTSAAYDLFLTSGTGIVTALIFGRIIMKEAVTKI